MHVTLIWALFALCPVSTEQDLNDHHVDGKHNPEHDANILLGRKDPDEVGELSPAEQKRRLAVIVKKIDSNSDGFLTEGEIILWIKQVYKGYALEDVKERLPELDKDGDGAVSWDEYNVFLHGHVIEVDENTVREDPEEESIRILHLKYKKRFNHADADGNSGLNLTELLAFLHPSEVDHMADYAIEDIRKDFDQDNDGFISLNEFLGDVRSPDGENRTQWEIYETVRFKSLYDMDGDGKLNNDEQLLWVAPNSFGTAREEAFQLIKEMDSNGDGKLSEAEIMANQQIFVQSEVTDYGRQLHSIHDEL
ncbi:reticulocalbin-2 isoform X2 [Amia ocellicauda]